MRAGGWVGAGRGGAAGGVPLSSPACGGGRRAVCAPPRSLKLTARPGGSRRPAPPQNRKSILPAGTRAGRARAPTGGRPCPGRGPLGSGQRAGGSPQRELQGSRPARARGVEARRRRGAGGGGGIREGWGEQARGGARACACGGEGRRVLGRAKWKMQEWRGGGRAGETGRATSREREMTKKPALPHPGRYARPPLHTHTHTHAQSQGFHTHTHT